MHRLLLPVCLVAAFASPAYAQSEPELRDFFEGKSVAVKIDMPATQEGIDLYPDARRAIAGPDDRARPDLSRLPTAQTDAGESIPPDAPGSGRRRRPGRSRGPDRQ